VFICGEVRDRYRYESVSFWFMMSLRLHIGDKVMFVGKIQGANKAHSLQNQRYQLLGPIFFFRYNDKTKPTKKIAAE